MKTNFFNFLRLFFQIPFAEKWLVKHVKSKSSNSFYGKLVPNNYQYPKGSIREFEFNGVNLKLDIHDYVSHYLYFQFKDYGMEQLMNLVEKDYFVLDIGTNYGSTILQFARKVGKNGTCFGFEPDPINFKICTENLNLNSDLKISVENIGLGDKKGTFNLVVDTESNRGGNRISTNTSGKESHTVNVEVLDQWISNKSIERLDLIKIDVEGFELNVLKGGIETLKKFKPVLFIELDDENLKLQNHSAKELIEFLENLGYSLLNAVSNKQILSTDDFTFCHFDVVAKI